MPPKRGGSTSVSWFWQNDEGVFAPYDAGFQRTVESHFVAAAGKGVATFSYKNWGSYEFDFDAWTQKNLESGKVRAIKRHSDGAPAAPPGPVAKWAFRDTPTTWKEYDPASSSLLEEAFQAKSPAIVLTINKIPYPVNFASMTQTNTATAKTRKICRYFDAPPDESEEPEAKKSKPEIASGSTGGVSAGTKKLLKKGKGIVDPLSGLAGSCHVYEDAATGLLYQVMLNQTNVDQNNNKFYVIQLLEDDTKKGSSFHVFTRWGRVGASGATATDSYSSVLPAIDTFRKKFRDKTGNAFGASGDFVKYPGKYQLMAIDLGDDGEDASKPSTVLDVAATGGDMPASKLPSSVQALVKMIANTADMTQSMKELEIDTNKMPLGKISKKQIKDAFQFLKDIETELKKPKPDHSTIVSATSMFYTLIPHDFGMMKPPLISTNEMLKRKMDLLDILGDLEIASKLLTTAKKTGVNPIDQAYETLQCNLSPVAHESELFRRIEEYVRNTHGPTHNSYKLVVEDVIEVDRPIESVRYKAFEGLHNKQMLWHGSRTTNFMGILSQGLRIAPPEAPATGYMFGKGVYFADVSSKSANYCNASTTNPHGILILCEAALGTTKDLTNALYMDKPQPGSDSTKGVGKSCPNPAASVVVDGVTWPMGKVGPAAGVGATVLLYPEYIVYNVAQCRMRYLVRIKFEYGKYNK
jgi:predicted DNA-binding WGR domain protein